jgi:hypothetical protein
MILPLASMRKHSEIVIAPRRLTSPESASTDVHERSRLASGEGGASAVLGATVINLHGSWRSAPLLVEKEPRLCRFADHPTGPLTLLHKLIGITHARL